MTDLQDVVKNGCKMSPICHLSKRNDFQNPAMPFNGAHFGNTYVWNEILFLKVKCFRLTFAKDILRRLHGQQFMHQI